LGPKLLQLLENGTAHLTRPGVRQRIEAQQYCWFAVEGRVASLVGAQLDAAHVAQPDDSGRGVASRWRSSGLPVRDDDVAEIARLREPARRADVQLEELAFWHRRLPDLTGRDLDVLLAERHNHVRWREVARCQLVGIEQDAHSIVALAEQDDVAH